MTSLSNRFLAHIRVGLLVALTLIVVASSLTQIGTRNGSPSEFYWRLPIHTSHGFQHGQNVELASGVVGNVSIVNLLLMCAVQSNPDGTLLPRPDVSTQLVISDSSGEELLVPVSWYEIFNCGSFFGTFRTNLLPGTYFITLSYCSQNYTSGGCDQLPKIVYVGDGGMTQVILDIEEGIWVARGNPLVASERVVVEVFPPRT